MKFHPTYLEGAFVVEPEPISDERGLFMRTYCKTEFARIGHNKDWVQMNHSVTKRKGTIRGMHLQTPPHAEIKLVRCIAGSVWDVIIDMRSGSPGFLQWFGIELSAGSRQMLYIPEGFAHGFQTLTDDCEMVYCHSASYAGGHEQAVRYNDPLIGINWPLPVTEISARDQTHPLLTKQYTGIKI